MNMSLNLANYRSKTVHFFNIHLLGRLENLLASDKDEALRFPPIFILGAPRSGSTLAVQVITDTLDIGYISNRHCKWFGAPALAERLFRPTKDRPRSNFQSRQGTTKGWYAPAECGEWWYRFFRRNPPYMTLDEVCPHRMRAFRRSVTALTNAFNKPILFKNLYASLRIQAIAHYLPESLFIITHRNEIDNGHSLLETRRTVLGNYEEWWSMEPPNTESLKMLPSHQQVIEQIRHIHTTIEHDLELAKVPQSRRFHLTYDNFCANPAETIESLNSFLEGKGCNVVRRLAPPASFKRRDAIKIDKNLYKAMVDYASWS